MPSIFVPPTSMPIRTRQPSHRRVRNAIATATCTSPLASGKGPANTRCVRSGGHVSVRGAVIVGVLTGVAVVVVVAPARAQTCMVLRYDFQPDCYRAPGGGACLRSIDRLDLGPQIAVWLESADRTM